MPTEAHEVREGACMTSDRAWDIDDQSVPRTNADTHPCTVDDRRTGASKRREDGSEISSYVVNNLGGEHLQLQLRTLLKVEDFDQQIGTHLENTSVRFRRGEVPWVDVMAEVDGYFVQH